MLGESDPSYDREKLRCPDDSGLEHCDVCEQDVPPFIAVYSIGYINVCQACRETHEPCSRPGCGKWLHKSDVLTVEGKRVCTDCAGAEQGEV